MKSFRAKVSSEQWKKWLNFARTEKKKRGVEADAARLKPGARELWNSLVSVASRGGNVPFDGNESNFPTFDVEPNKDANHDDVEGVNYSNYAFVTGSDGAVDNEQPQRLPQRRSHSPPVVPVTEHQSILTHEQQQFQPRPSKWANAASVSKKTATSELVRGRSASAPPRRPPVGPSSSGQVLPSNDSSSSNSRRKTSPATIMASPPEIHRSRSPLKQHTPPHVRQSWTDSSSAVQSTFHSSNQVSLQHPHHSEQRVMQPSAQAQHYFHGASIAISTPTTTTTTASFSPSSSKPSSRPVPSTSVKQPPHRGLVPRGAFAATTTTAATASGEQSLPAGGTICTPMSSVPPIYAHHSSGVSSTPIPYTTNNPRSRSTQLSSIEQATTMAVNSASKLDAVQSMAQLLVDPLVGPYDESKYRNSPIIETKTKDNINSSGGGGGGGREGRGERGKLNEEDDQLVSLETTMGVLGEMMSSLAQSQSSLRSIAALSSTSRPRHDYDSTAAVAANLDESHDEYSPRSLFATAPTGSVTDIRPLEELPSYQKLQSPPQVYVDKSSFGRHPEPSRSILARSGRSSPLRGREVEINTSNIMSSSSSKPQVLFDSDEYDSTHPQYDNIGEINRSSSKHGAENDPTFDASDTVNTHHRWGSSIGNDHMRVGSWSIHNHPSSASYLDCRGEGAIPVPTCSAAAGSVSGSGSSASIVRICIAKGALIKAFDEHPVRVNEEAATVDVVWRSRSSTGRGSSGGSTGGVQALTLRRERFSFDEVMSGSTATDRLNYFVENRVDRALKAGRNVVFMCLACAHNSELVNSAMKCQEGTTRTASRFDNIAYLPRTTVLEPSVALAVGASGGTGIIDCVLGRIFKFIRPAAAAAAATCNGADGSTTTFEKPPLKSASNGRSPFLAVQLEREAQQTRVALSAVILSDGFHVTDLLAPSAAGGGNSSVGIRRHRDNNRISVQNMARVSLKDPRDFDRIIGVVLGKRAATNETIDMLLYSIMGASGSGGSGSMNGVQRETARSIVQHIYSSSPWSVRMTSETSSTESKNSSRYYQRFDDDGVEEEDPYMGQTGGGFSSSRISSTETPSQTLLLSLTISTSVGVGRSSSSTRKGKNQTFSFVCPCGPAWGKPSRDLGVFAGAVSALPHEPPPSVARSSVLSALLLDSGTASRSDYITLCSVRRPSDESHMYNGGNSGDAYGADPAALHALRIVGHISK